jgi:NAD(P)-dependent dehydrogenase (short-subunit alcohol dehydrogenase family)
MSMTSTPSAVVTGAGSGIGRSVARILLANGWCVALAGRSRDSLEETASESDRAQVVPTDVSDPDSVQALFANVCAMFGRLDLLVNNAAISNTSKLPGMSIGEYAKLTRPSNVSLDEMRAVWETNVFGVLAVYQAMLPLLRESSDARIVNVSSGVGSLTDNANPAFAYRPMFGPVYPASKTALNAITLAMMIELESTGIKVNLVSPAFTKTNLNGYAGTETVEDGSREVVRVALLGPDGPTGTFTRWENVTIPW